MMRIVLQLYYSKEDADCLQQYVALDTSFHEEKPKTTGGVTEPFLYYDANGSSGASQSTLSN